MQDTGHFIKMETDVDDAGNTYTRWTCWCNRTGRWVRNDDHRAWLDGYSHMQEAIRAERPGTPAEAMLWLAQADAAAEAERRAGRNLLQRLSDWFDDQLDRAFGDR